MILLLHEIESLKNIIIGSIRITDSLMDLSPGKIKELPEGTKKPLKIALQILVDKQIISEEQSADIQEIIEIRNFIGHDIHTLVEDISNPDKLLLRPNKYDYGALERLKRYRITIEKGLGESYVMLLSLRRLAFEQAELTYKEELARLKIKIDRQYSERSKKMPK